VKRAADLLKLTPYLDRTPLHLSGGQQQRTAIARAICKNAGVVLLDEPLANLDYKLREELREELPKIFAETGAIFVYATTEPHEALLLGGNTATLSEGRVTQFGPTIEVFRRPRDLLTARTFSDPPLNTIVLRKKGVNFLLDGGVNLPVPAELAGIADASYTIGFQPHHLSVERPTASAVSVAAKVLVTEVTGSESFVHLAFADARWVMFAHGVRIYEPDDTLEVFIDPRHIMVFDESGRAVSGSERLAA
jgi:glycerol transport system ATP-binding protein